MPHDILLDKDGCWRAAESAFLNAAGLCGFRELRAPSSAGPDALRKAAEQAALPDAGLPLKLCGLIDAPEGRLFCAELIGPPYPAAAAELISLAGDFLALLNLPDIQLELAPGGESDGLTARLEAMNLAWQENPALPPDSFSLLCGGETLCAGGRREGQWAGAGFAVDGEKLLAALAARGIALPGPEPCALYIAADGEEAEIAAMAMAADLRGEGFAAESGLMGLPVSEQLACAERIGARFTMVLDADCLAAGRAEIRDTATGETFETAFGEALSRFFYDRQILELTGALEGLPLGPELGE